MLFGISLLFGISVLFGNSMDPIQDVIITVSLQQNVTIQSRNKSYLFSLICMSDPWISKLAEEISILHDNLPYLFGYTTGFSPL